MHSILVISFARRIFYDIIIIDTQIHFSYTFRL